MAAHRQHESDLQLALLYCVLAWYGTSGTVAVRYRVWSMNSSNEPIRWGLLGTARINAKLLAGRAGTDDADGGRRGQPLCRDGRRPTPGPTASPGPTAHTRRCWPTREVDAVYISLPNATASPLDAHGAGGRQARPLREALHAPSRRGRHRLGRGGRCRSGAHGGASCGGIRRRPTDWSSCCRASASWSRSARTFGHNLAGDDDIRVQRGPRWWLAHGRGLLLRQCRTPHRRAGARRGLRRSRSPPPTASTARFAGLLHFPSGPDRDVPHGLRCAHRIARGHRS